MAVEINPASDTLQIKHQSTGKWTPGMTLLRLEEGYDVRLVESQMAQIDAIVQKMATLATLTSSQDLQRSLASVTQSLSTLVTQGGSQSTSLATFYQSITTAISQLSQLSQSTGTTNQAIASQLGALSAAVNSLISTLSQLSQSSSQSSSQSTTTVTIPGETNVFETLITIPAANQVQPCLLPNTTKSLVFSGRKDSNNKSYDIYWSFTRDNMNMNQGNYKILWAYNEYQKSGLSFKDKTLYLSCSVPIQIDVCAYFY